MLRLQRRGVPSQGYGPGLYESAQNPLEQNDMGCCNIRVSFPMHYDGVYVYVHVHAYVYSFAHICCCGHGSETSKVEHNPHRICDQIDTCNPTRSSSEL